jgi:Zn finger protein HypA/HybF involved in hydrogenase expression
MTEETTTIEEVPASEEVPPILFYCKTCKKVIVDPKKHPKKYEYKCPVCSGFKVVFGSKEAITGFFSIKDSMLENMLANPNQA